MNFIYSLVGYPNPGTTIKEINDLTVNQSVQPQDVKPEGDATAAPLEIRGNDTDWEMLFEENDKAAVKNPKEEIAEKSISEAFVSPSSDKVAIQTPAIASAIISFENLSHKQKELLTKLENHPDDYDAHCDLAATLSGNLRIAVGKENFNQKLMYLKASKIDPKKTRAYFQLALLLDKEERISYGALGRVLVKLIEINPNHLEAFELLGKHFERIKLENGTEMSKNQILEKVTELKRIAASYTAKV